MHIFLDNTNRLRTVWRFALFLIALFGARIVASIVLMFGFAVVQVVQQFVHHGAFDPIALQAALEETATNTSEWMMLFGAESQTRASVIVVIAFRLWLDRRSLGSLGLTAPPWLRGQPWSWRRSWPMAFLLGSAPIVVGFLIVWYSGGFRTGGVAFRPEALIFSAALVFAAFSEEIICRGYLLQNLIDIDRPVTAVLVSSTIFWLFHGLNPSAWESWYVSANLFLAGVLLALAYLVSRDLWFPTILHFAWNFTQGIVLDIKVSGLDTPGAVEVTTNPASPTWLTGGNFGLEGSAVTTGIMLVMIAGLALTLRNVASDRGSTELAEVQPPSAGSDEPC